MLCPGFLVTRTPLFVLFPSTAAGENARRTEGYALEMPHDPTAVSLTFIGTATTSMRVGAFTVLTDPNFLRPVARGETTRLAEEGTAST